MSLVVIYIIGDKWMNITEGLKSCENLVKSEKVEMAPALKHEILWESISNLQNLREQAAVLLTKIMEGGDPFIEDKVTKNIPPPLADVFIALTEYVDSINAEIRDILNKIHEVLFYVK